MRSKDLQLKKALIAESHQLAKVEVPILTVSASFRKELSYEYQALPQTIGDLIYSRAHYSMAEAVKRKAEQKHLTAYVADPINYVTVKGWQKVSFTETVGKLIARNRCLKNIKEKLDRLIRGNSPISQPIVKPLQFLSQDINKPIICLHYEVANLLAANHQVICVVTDPHVRQEYLKTLPTQNAGQIKKTYPSFAVFDQQTKSDFLSLAQQEGKFVDTKKIVVTGPPIDPRILRCRHTKKPPKNRPVRLAITTGGLGQNLKEIKNTIKPMVELLKKPEKIQLFLFAGTHRDFRNFYEDFAQKNHIRIGDLDDESARLRILYEDSVIDANENLIEYVFDWADGVITKPSGDMAYDAVGAGCFVLFLDPWGEWEENIQERFVKQGLGYDINHQNFVDMFNKLSKKDFFQKAMKAAQNQPEIFYQGANNIVDLQQQLAG